MDGNLFLFFPQDEVAFYVKINIVFNFFVKYGGIICRTWWYNLPYIYMLLSGWVKKKGALTKVIHI
jgi:hypothetical protein